MAKAKRKTPDVYEDERTGLRPGSAALMVVALGFGTAIVWNAFNGHHQTRDLDSLLAEIPAGASTSVRVEAPVSAAPRTITIKYDATVEDMQRELRATGHYRGPVDGVLGNQTVIAVKQYQKANGLAADGKVTEGLLEHVRFTRKVAAASEQTGSLAPKPVAEPAKQVRKAQPANDAARVRILDVQMRLTRLGYETGETDGVLGAGTRSAILKFELDQGLAMEGKITKPFLAALKAAESGDSTMAQQDE